MSALQRRISVLEQGRPQSPLAVQADRKLRECFGVKDDAGPAWMSCIPTPELMRVRDELAQKGPDHEEH